MFDECCQSPPFLSLAMALGLAPSDGAIWKYDHMAVQTLEMGFFLHGQVIKV